MFYYVPSTTQAYDRMLDLRGTVAFGIILRNMHRWSAHGMVAVVFLHMCRVFFTGSYKKPREFNWVVGVALFLLTLLLELHRLPAALGPAGLLGHHRGHLHRRLRPARRQGHPVPAPGRRHRGPGSAAALLRAPRRRAAGGAHLFVAIHFWRIRKDGGLAKPEEARAAPNLPSRWSLAAPLAGGGSCRRGAPAPSAFRAWYAGRLSKWASSRKTPCSAGPICSSPSFLSCC